MPRQANVSEISEYFLAKIQEAKKKQLKLLTKLRLKPTSTSVSTS
jgi:hypothetical protein